MSFIEEAEKKFYERYKTDAEFYSDVFNYAKSFSSQLTTSVMDKPQIIRQELYNENFDNYVRLKNMLKAYAIFRDVNMVEVDDEYFCKFCHEVLISPVYMVDHYEKFKVNIADDQILFLRFFEAVLELNNETQTYGQGLIGISYGTGIDIRVFIIKRKASEIIDYLSTKHKNCEYDHIIRRQAEMRQLEASVLAEKLITL